MTGSRRQEGFLDKPGLLDPLFEPGSLVVLGGASGAAAAARLRDRLREDGFQGSVSSELDGASPPASLALITASLDELPLLLPACAARGIPFAVLFGHAVPGGAGLAALSGIPSPRLLGPNSVGILRPWLGLYATTFPHRPRPGPVGFLTQSGAFGAGILDWSLRANVGFSAFVSLGTLPGVTWGDLIYRLGDDARTRSILIYMESLDDPRSFLSAAREVARTKPIIVLKAGRTPEGARAAAGHTLQAPGDDHVLDAAFRRCGVLRVERISDLFYMSEVLSKQPLPRGPRLAIVTNASGPSVLAVDALVSNGGELARRAANPFGLLPGEPPSAFAAAVVEAARDEATDGVLAVLTPQSAEFPTIVAEALRPHAHATGKPLLASFLGGREAAGGVAILNEAGIPTVPYPDTAARSFTYMVRFARNLANLYETPQIAGRGMSEERLAVLGAALDSARAGGREDLTSGEVASLLRAYGLAAIRGAASELHEGAVPLRIVSRVDPQFGPVLALSAGGGLSTFLPGESLGLPPLNSTLARLMVDRSGLRPALVRASLPIEALEEALVRLSALVSEFGRLRELVLDPAWLAGDGLYTDSCAMTLHPFSLPDSSLPPLAIRPYPEQYVTKAVLKNGEPVRIRPIRAEDEPAMVEFHKGLSERSVYFRYFQILNLSQRTAHERLTRICFIDYAREMALVAERASGEILGVARLSRLHGTNHAEFAVLVADSWQGQGIGLHLLSRLTGVARAEGLAAVAGQIHPENRGMIALARKAGFLIRDLVDEGVVESYLSLSEAAPAQ